LKNALIICTYMRPQALKSLLDSVLFQSKIPDEVLIIDGSTNNDTKELIQHLNLNLNLVYYLVDSEHRGLTRQRNFGVAKISKEMEIISFLDDDLFLEPTYFEEIEKTFLENNDAIGVGGIDLKENRYFKKEENAFYSSFDFYELDGWVIKEPLRYKARKLIGLMSDLQPDIIPAFSHGRSGFPPNGVVYQVEHLMGMSMSFRVHLFEEIKFSSYFEGYGLYEDFDFCVRALSFGKLYVNTNAQVWHYHEQGGRPNQYKYGKMVLRNGWHVWKLRFPVNSLNATFKWHLTSLLLAHIRLLNVLTGPKRFSALTEYFGRLTGWVSLWIFPPKIEK